MFECSMKDQQNEGLGDVTNLQIDDQKFSVEKSNKFRYAPAPSTKMFVCQKIQQRHSWQNLIYNECIYVFINHYSANAMPDKTVCILLAN